MFSHKSELSIGIRVGILVEFHYPYVILDTSLLWIWNGKANMNCGSCVCDNDFMSIFGDCPSNELLELLKSKKYARMFKQMLKYLKHRNHMLHNSLCESNSLIEKYKRRNRHFCNKLNGLKRKFTHPRKM